MINYLKEKNDYKFSYLTFISIHHLVPKGFDEIKKEVRQVVLDQVEEHDVKAKGKFDLMIAAHLCDTAWSNRKQYRIVDSKMKKLMGSKEVKLYIKNNEQEVTKILIDYFESEGQDNKE